MTAEVREPARHQGGGNNPSSVSEIDERLYRRGIGHRGQLSGQDAWESEGERTDSEAEGRESAEGGAALDSDGLERTIEDALKVADIDDLQEVGRLAHERDPEKYPYTHLTSLTTANYVAGNPLYDILHDGRTTFDGPPLLSLKSLKCRPLNDAAVAEWKVDMPALTTTNGGWVVGATFPNLKVFTGALPNLQDGWLMFNDSGLTSWDVELPSLTSAMWMFRNTPNLVEWRGSLANLELGDQMFAGSKLSLFSTDSLSHLTTGHYMFYGDKLTSFPYALPSLTNVNQMFFGCKLDLPSVQTIARTIKDNVSMATPPNLHLGVAKALQGQVDAELDFIRAKGWALTTQYN